MDNRIIVIHPSEIIRQGLHRILKMLFDIDAILLNSIDDLKNYHKISGSKIIFLADARLNFDIFPETVAKFKKSHEVIVVLLNDNVNEQKDHPSCDSYLSINASKSMIFDLVDPYLQRANNTPVKQKSTGLTDREIDVVKEVALGKTNKEIAEKLHISIHTVISHRKNITEKLGIKSISGLTVYAVLNNLIDTNTMDINSLI
jgi:DNA-binding CsgD family transcriptional regulator